MRKADNLPPSCAVVTKSENLNFLEPSGPVQACNGTALPFFFTYVILMYKLQKNRKIFTTKFVGTGPSSDGKANLPGRGPTKFDKHWSSRQLPQFHRNFMNTEEADIDEISVPLYPTIRHR